MTARMGDDVTDRALASTLGKLLESLPDAVIVTSTEGRVEFVNQRALSLFGYDRKELIGQPVSVLVPEGLHRNGSGDESNGAGNSSTPPLTAREPYGRCRDGREFPAEISRAPLQMPNRTLVTAVVRDITERKKLEEQLRQLQLLVTQHEPASGTDAFDRFFTLSLDMLCIAGVDGYFRRLNPAFDVLGYKGNELLSKPFLDFVHPDDRAATLAEVGKLSTGVPTIFFENRYRCQDGSYRWLAWTSAPDASGTLYAVARDITELKRMQRELIRAKETVEAANRELEAFSYSVAHDLRAPLRSIDGFSQALLDDYATKLDEDGLKYLRFVRESAQLMARLIDDMLTLSRVTRSELSHDTVDLSALARATCARLTRSDPARSVEVVIQDGVMGRGDSRLLAVALDNLFGNAWKFTAKRIGARIEFGASSDAGARPTYFIRDNGAGFDMAYASKLFGVFQRLHSAHEFEGTGVGLATVQRIIHRHGGRVWAEGKVDAGATFHFTLGNTEHDA